jgi:hypothetical protein
MTADEERDWSLIDFAKKLAGISETKPVAGFNFYEPVPDSGALAPAFENEERKIASTPDKDKDTQTAADLSSTHASQFIAATTSGKKQLKTPEEIAKIIMTALQSIDSCPDRGFIVTVYGSNPWNAMLTIRPEVGPSIDRRVWLSRVEELGVQLRNDFDVIQ